MIDVACHQNIGANFVVLLITRLGLGGELEASVTVYLPDGTISPGVLDLEAAQVDPGHG